MSCVPWSLQRPARLSDKQWSDVSFAMTSSAEQSSLYKVLLLTGHLLSHEDTSPELFNTALAKVLEYEKFDPTYIIREHVAKYYGDPRLSDLNKSRLVLNAAVA